MGNAKEKGFAESFIKRFIRVLDYDRPIALYRFPEGRLCDWLPLTDAEVAVEQTDGMGGYPDQFAILHQRGPRKRDMDFLNGAFRDHFNNGSDFRFRVHQLAGKTIQGGKLLAPGLFFIE